MKKTLAIILSIVMLIGVMPFASFAAEPAYDRAAVAANDEEYIADMTAEERTIVKAGSLINYNQQKQLEK